MLPYLWHSPVTPCETAALLRCRYAKMTAILASRLAPNFVLKLDLLKTKSDSRTWQLYAKSQVGNMKVRYAKEFSVFCNDGLYLSVDDTACLYFGQLVS